MGNALETIQRYDRSPASWRHLVHCYLHDLQQTLQPIYKDTEFHMFSTLSVSVLHLITAYVVYHDTFKLKLDANIEYSDNRMTVTNVSANPQEIINIYGQYTIRPHSFVKHITYTWTLHVQQCHFVAIGLAQSLDRHEHDDHEMQQSRPFYFNRNMTSYSITNEGKIYTNTEDNRPKPDPPASSELLQFTAVVQEVFAELDSSSEWETNDAVRDGFDVAVAFEMARDCHIAQIDWDTWIKQEIVEYVKSAKHGGWDTEYPIAPGFSDGAVIDMELYIYDRESDGVALSDLVFYDHRARTCEYGRFEKIRLAKEDAFCLAVSLGSNEIIKSSVSLTAFSCNDDQIDTDIVTEVEVTEQNDDSD